MSIELRDEHLGRRVVPADVAKLEAFYERALNRFDPERGG